MSSQTGVLRRWKPYLQKIAQNIIHVQNSGENRKEERREREREREKEVRCKRTNSFAYARERIERDAEIFHTTRLTQPSPTITLGENVVTLHTGTTSKWSNDRLYAHRHKT